MEIAALAGGRAASGVRLFGEGYNNVPLNSARFVVREGEDGFHSQVKWTISGLPMFREFSLTPTAFSRAHSP
jgi:hypothetical protein